MVMFTYKICHRKFSITNNIKIYIKMFRNLFPILLLLYPWNPFTMLTNNLHKRL